MDIAWNLGKGELMSDYLFISDAAKEVKVESHVLRYWEEELHLPIKRNELGHRYYTEEDVERFKQIKGMKERGLQLKAIKMILKDGRLDVLPSSDEEAENVRRQIQVKEDARQCREGGLAIDIKEPEPVNETAAPGTGVREADVSAAPAHSDREEKSRRLQWLLQQLIRQTLQENNHDLCREIRESVVKELDYQFRMQEEREEARDRMLAQRDEEHYKKMDELLRKKSRVHKKIRQEKKGQEKEQDLKSQAIPLDARSDNPPAASAKKKKRFL